MYAIDANDLRSRLLAHYFASASDPADLVRRFGAVQIDAVSIVAPNQALVFAARECYSAASDIANLYQRHGIIEVYAKERCLIPQEDAPLFWPLLKQRRQRHDLLFREHRFEIRRLLAAVRAAGTISAGDLSSPTLAANDGWGPRRLGTKLLGLLWETGALVVRERAGTRTTYGVAPEDMWHRPKENRLSAKELRLARWSRYLEGVAITDSRDSFAGFERCSAVDRRRLLTALLDSGTATPVSGLNRAKLCVVSTKLIQAPEMADSLPCFVPPLDTFLWHRPLVHDLWGFDYKWEIYTPPEKRKFGPYAMPLVTASGVYGPVDFRMNRTERILYGRLSASPLQMAPKMVMAAAEAAAIKLTRALGAETVQWI